MCAFLTVDTVDHSLLAALSKAQYHLEMTCLNMQLCPTKPFLISNSYSLRDCLQYNITKAL